MTRAQAERLFDALLHTWPHGGHAEPSTRRVYVAYLEGLSELSGAAAVQACTKSCKWFPTIAELDTEAKTIAHRLRYQAIEAERLPVDPVGKRKVDALASWLSTNKIKPITNADLDRAGVVNWRRRMADAADADAAEGRHFEHYDEAWAEVRREYYANIGAPVPEIPGSW